MGSEITEAAITELLELEAKATKAPWQIADGEANDKFIAALRNIARPILTELLSLRSALSASQAECGRLRAVTDEIGTALKSSDRDGGNAVHFRTAIRSILGDLARAASSATPEKGTRDKAQS